MPIYTYDCEKCGKTYDIRQRLADARLSECPVCRSTKFRRAITAPMVKTKSRSVQRISRGTVGDFGPEP